MEKIKKINEEVFKIGKYDFIKFTGDDGSIIPLPLRFLLAFRRLRRCRGHLIPKFVGKECTDNAPFAVV